MDVVGISEEEQVSLLEPFMLMEWKFCIGRCFINVSNMFQEAIFRVVAAILHLGNIEFSKGEEIDSSVIKDERSRFHLSTTAELLKYVPNIILL